MTFLKLKQAYLTIIKNDSFTIIQIHFYDLVKKPNYAKREALVFFRFIKNLVYFS
jgi:hypothetical protein